MNARPPVELVVAAWDDPILTTLRTESRPRADARALGLTPQPRAGPGRFTGATLDEAGLVYVVARRLNATGKARVGAETSDGVVGCAGLRRLGDDIAEVASLYVRPACRGQGISRLLLAGVEDLARGRGFTAVRLTAVDPRTARLYASRGYVRIAPIGHRPSGVCFEKSLAVPERHAPLWTPGGR
jgi:GNAT superfamily N-acetyltransferase